MMILHCKLWRKTEREVGEEKEGRGREGMREREEREDTERQTDRERWEEGGGRITKIL